MKHKELVNDLRNAMQDIENKYFKDHDIDQDKVVISFERKLMLLENRGKIFRHFKGDSYLLIDIAEHTETGEKMVVYKALYGDCKVYARPISMFLEEVPKDKQNPTGQRYRFEAVEYESLKDN